MSGTGERGWRARAALLALGAFAVSTDGFVIIGLLPEISRTLQVSIAEAGQLVSVFTIAYALMSPVLATITGTWSRRRVLVCALVLLGTGNAVTALVQDYGLVLVSRVLAGCGAALFSASAVATAAHLAGDQRRGRAVAMVTAGSTLALVLGAPLGTLIGNAWGWQAAIWLVTVVSGIVAAAVAVMLPSIRLDQGSTLRQRLLPLTDRRVLWVLVVTLSAFIGIFLPFTYMSAVFAPATGGDQARLALLLLVFGVAATGGNLMAGALADRYDPRFVVIGATAGISAVFLLMLPIRESFVLVVIMHALSGVVSFSVIGPQQHRIIGYAPPGGAPLVTALNVSTAHLGNFLSSVIGAVVIATTGSAALLLPIAAAFALVAAFLTWWFGHSEQAGAEEVVAGAGQAGESARGCDGPGDNPPTPAGQAGQPGRPDRVSSGETE
ncbi:MFS transporter [Streptomyces thermolilacinus]|uniref:MFS transporter n=1 Tax=Streptomyces thermolilacinus SPC6 TaxID=1306406 RepID=A0A1D3DNH7_9ACTN|nr:MFS transporter [Streptomyces thermolilacinus]OEJ93873.1 MFS transporter [Streptomyces thermolilacinus SPC6]